MCKLHAIVIAHGDTRAELIQRLEEAIKDIRQGIHNAIQGHEFEFDVFVGKHFYASELYNHEVLKNHRYHKPDHDERI